MGKDIFKMILRSTLVMLFATCAVLTNDNTLRLASVIGTMGFGMLIGIAIAEMVFKQVFGIYEHKKEQ